MVSFQPMEKFGLIAEIEGVEVAGLKAKMGLRGGRGVGVMLPWLVRRWRRRVVRWRGLAR